MLDEDIADGETFIVPDGDLFLRYEGPDMLPEDCCCDTVPGRAGA